MLFTVSVAVALLSSALGVQALPFTNLTSSAAGVITSCTVKNTAALTFDDGPYEYIQDISDKLTAAGAKGTFFMNGNNYRCIYEQESIDRVKYAYNAGHQIGSHTWAHKDLATLSKTEIDSEMSRVEQALKRIIGIVPAFTRPPFGSYNDQVRQVAQARNQKLVNWDFDSGDSTGSTAAQSNAAYDDLVKQHPASVLALNHEVYEQTAHAVVPHAISVLQGAGYKLVTLAECLGQQPYISTGKPQQGSWSC